MRRYTSNSLQPLLLEGANTNARSNSFEERFNKYIRNTKLRFLAAEGKLNVYGVVAAGTFGSWLGAAASYWVALWLGRVVIARWGRYFFINEAKLERAERWLHRYETGGIFFARLLPVIRHLISFPAGLIRMNFARFSLMTIVGSALWCSVLAWFGQTVIGQL